MDTLEPAVDSRQYQLEQWLADQLGAQLTGVAAGSDAGFRRYFRYQHNGRSLIAMDAPPETEDCRPFIKVAAMLAESGVLVPEILAQDLEQGFLLLSDLGLQTYLDVMNSEGFSLSQADTYFADAISALIKFQLTSQPDQLPPYDEALLRRELSLFPEWYLQRHLGLTLDAELTNLLEQLFDQLINHIQPQHRVYVHRDYMPRNLMVNQGSGVGVLDFQDAVYGPISYDISCLFKDAFISWPEQKVSEWLSSYWSQAQQAGLPVPEQFADFQRDCDIMGAQRHLKVIGIFARICHRDGKPRYLADTTRFFKYLNTVAQRRPELPALKQLLALLETRIEGPL
ncbi:aminoglycoside phosphotransferase family protein [Oceanicoccus sagamiensis]|uniref:Aminoglycoside phosphotransferase n=1 Tax=Oceanicoccus sagamiensis TaxID=716816 RepID=A0A1X9N8A8_9GAMM|nr:phosphotransferase [Oceanicoccus sagamiensis]ARN74308.1 aminoglycoside phosphotransferase [Oceanicoccus sagamiensis]